MSTLTPREIVAELDKFVVGQEQAKLDVLDGRGFGREALAQFRKEVAKHHP